MNIDQAIDIIKLVLDEDRMNHSIRVAEVAAELACLYSEDIEKIKLAAILHDYAKNHPANELKRWIINSSLPKDLLFYHSAIWHGPVGALMIKQKYGVHDRKVLHAIHHHTTGNPQMTDFDKIIFVADYIEPARDFPGLKHVRESAYNDLDQTTYFILRNMIEYLMTKNQTIYPSTFYAYNKILEKLSNFGGHSF